MSEMVTVVGAGLAGCEAAWQLAQRGISVRLCEMKPVQHTPAHHSDDFAELVCSNSLRSDELANAAGSAQGGAAPSGQPYPLLCGCTSR